MKLERYSLDAVDFYSKRELERVKLLVFYYHSLDNQYEFSIEEICSKFSELGLHMPNKSRLKKSIITSKHFVKSQTLNTYRLHMSEFLNMKNDTKISKLNADEDIITFENTIIYKQLYLNTRGYIEKLALQINACYENNLFDGCAVLMRRLFEILLIHSYENQNIEQAIKDKTGNYRMLSDIVKDAKTNTKLSLSRDSKKALDDIRELGNYSAHRIHYNARKPDIEKLITTYRLVIEELLYKSGILK